jgi:hypothetical protein
MEPTTVFQVITGNALQTIDECNTMAKACAAAGMPIWKTGGR